MKQPNIIVYFSDQQRWDTLGCNGQPLDVTPRLDRMAEEGVNFKMAYTPQPVCGPARALLQSGLYPTQTGCYRNAKALPLDCHSLARRLKDAGYSVGYAGKWHLASEMPDYSRDNADNYEREPVPIERRGGYEDYWAASDVLEHTSQGYGGHVYGMDGEKRSFEGYRTDCVTSFALEYLEAQTGDKPFFIFLSHVEPHHQNSHNRFEGPEGSRERFAGFTPPPDLAPGEGDWEKEYPDYLGCCRALDDNLGRVLDKLKEKGVYDETIVIYTTDHGCHFQTKTNEKAPGGQDDYKRSCYESVIHIPLIIRGPGFAAGAIDNRLVSLMDIPKTIIEAAGGDSTGMQGDSLLDIGADNDIEWKQDVYIQISESFVGRAVRTERYTYCVHAPDKHPWKDSGAEVYRDRQLYDNYNDPNQVNNLVADPAFAEAKDNLRKRLLYWAEKAGEGIIEITDS